MYIFDFFRKTLKKNNIPVLIYLIINVGIIAYIFRLASYNELAVWQAILISIVVYFLSLCIALSPIGETILRLQTGCRKIKRTDQIEYIMPIFERVYEKAKIKDPSLPKDIQIYINDDSSANAFATGRKTICLTSGILRAPKQEVEAVLAHEFAHLSHKDTDLILVISVGNLIITACILIIKFFLDMFHLASIAASLILGGPEGFIGTIMVGVTKAFCSVVIACLMWIWTKLGILLVMKTSRDSEYDADKFAYELGYGNDLCAFLDFNAGDKSKGLFASIKGSHPHKDDRIKRLQDMGASYRVGC